MGPKGLSTHGAIVPFTHKLSTLHLEIVPRVDEMSVCEKNEGEKPFISRRKPIGCRGVWGHAPPPPPPGNLLFRLSEMASGAFSGTVFFYLLAIN